MWVLFALVGLLPSAAHAQSGSVTLTPDDTYLNLNSTTYSASETLTTFTWPDYKPANAILMKFDLSSIPAGAVITRATLSMALVSSSSGSRYSISAHRIRSGNPIIARATGMTSDGSHAWTANACCNKKVPLAQADIDLAEDTQDIDRTPGFKTWTITTMVSRWLADPSSNMGVLLNADATQSRNRYRTFASAENGDANLRPYLTITFQGASDATSPSITLTSPAAGATVSQTASLAATATDNVGVASVQFYVDNSPVGSADATAPYAVDWSTSAVADGTHAVTASARDLAGNTKMSAAVSVTVRNGVLTLTPDDTTLNINTTNYSKSTTLNTYTWPDNKAANAILMKFDLSKIPAGSVVQSATLYMSLTEADSAAETYRIAVHKITGKNPVPSLATGSMADGTLAWTSSSCCYNSIPLAQSDISFAVDTVDVDRTPGFKSWKVTSIVQDWLANPAANFGLLLNSDAGKPRDRFRTFASMENTNQALRPYLVLTLSSSGGQPTDTTPPTISGVASSAITSSSATIAWATNEAADTQVDYGTSTSYGSVTPMNSAMTTAHSAAVSGLNPSTRYYFRVRSRDQAGNLATSTGSFTTGAAAPTGDTTAPTISITAPSNGTTVSGSVTVSANASDNVGVAGVQFRVDGSTYGTEDTSAPYSSTWNTAGVSNGTHTITAVARDAAGNVRTSGSVTVTVSNTTSGGGGSGGGTTTPPVFQSNWSSNTGTSASAVTDGGKWPDYYEFNNGSNVQLMSVVSGAGPNGLNALRVEQRGSTYAANLQVNDVVAQSRDYYVRYYMKNDDTSGAGDHIVTADLYEYANLTFMRKYGSSSGWTFVTSLYGCGFTYPIGHWGPGPKLANGQWYRFEYFVDFIDNTHVRVHPRVYNSSGTLLYSDADFRQEDFGGASWNGRSDWTLASYYAAGHSFCVQPSYVNEFSVGNNGQQGAADTRQAWYFAGVEIRTDGWPGAVGSSGGSTGGSTDGSSGGSSGGSTGGSTGTSLSSRYPGDVNIESDPSVVLVEKFEQSSVSTMLSNWDDVMNGNRMVFSTDKPTGSPGTKSLDIPWIGGVTTGGHLFKELPTPIDDVLYVRYYIKYPAAGTYQHDGVWLGGYNPSLSYPNPMAGVRPNGNDRFSASAEQSDDGRRFDHYNYFSNMRLSGDGSYWGNTLLNNPSVTVAAGQWVCVEQMVKLNTPGSMNGEHAIWLNGTKVSHLGQGFPNGRWSGGNFIQDPSGSPFEGIRWRTDSNLKFTYIWLQNYSPNNNSGQGSMKFDHLVVAKTYIGCLQ
jgi:hypothetical protein